MSDLNNPFLSLASQPFDAASQGRRMRGWQASAAGPNSTVGPVA